jgi:peptide-methionine (S)-S-oxide reductase
MAQDNNGTKPTENEIATLAGGCFWCLEAVYDDLKGVEDVVSGYSGGKTPNPTYQQVSTGMTGHAETVQITFDPKQVSYEDLLHVFFTIHDPTTLNRQGADVGTQYRSVIFYHNPEQKEIAQRVIHELETEKVYVAKNPYQPYCQVVIAPKVAKFRKKYLERLKV